MGTRDVKRLKDQELSDEVMFHTLTNTLASLTQTWFLLSDRGAVCKATRPCALHGFPAFALAGSLSIAQSEEQQSRGG